jgi:hypothetical protein
MGYQDSAQHTHSITMVPQNQTATIKGEKGGKQDEVVIVSVGSRRSVRGAWCVVRVATCVDRKEGWWLYLP